MPLLTEVVVSLMFRTRDIGSLENPKAFYLLQAPTKIEYIQGAQIDQMAIK